MANEQLKLFTWRNALHERFDGAFFRGLPTGAGVYLMYDRAGRLLYVGKARNLRQRIGSYRYAAEECSRKTARLVARVTDIRWQICDCEESALLEENRLLRELRPRFNRMNTWPKAARFVRLTQAAHALELRLEAEANGECYGAFKGASRQNFSALLRLLWCFERPYADLPRPLLCELAPRTYEFPTDAARPWLESLRALLRGDGDGLLHKCSGATAHDRSAFHSAFRTADLLALEHFFRIGPERNRALREEFGVEPVISQTQLDDLLVRYRHRGEGAAAPRAQA